MANSHCLLLPGQTPDRPSSGWTPGTGRVWVSFPAGGTAGRLKCSGAWWEFAQRISVVVYESAVGPGSAWTRCHAAADSLPLVPASLKLDKHAIVALSFPKNLTDRSEKDRHILQTEIEAEGDKIAALKYLKLWPVPIGTFDDCATAVTLHRLDNINTANGSLWVEDV